MSAGKSPVSLEEKIKQYFLPFADQVELLILTCLLFSGMCLIFIQTLMGMNEQVQVYLNKAIQYEGVFQQDERIEVKATLQRH